MALWELHERNKQKEEKKERRCQWAVSVGYHFNGEGEAMAEKSSIILIDMDDTTTDDIENALKDWEIIKISVSELLVEKLIQEKSTLAFIMLNAQPERARTLEICKKLKGAPQIADIPLLVALDRSQASQVQYALEVGVKKCVIKPLDEKYLKKAIGEFI